jgi:hypothetical protein
VNLPKDVDPDKSISDPYFWDTMAPSIIVKELTMETIEAAIKYYVEERDGYWLKFCHLGTEIDDKTLNVLTDRWFAKTQWIR